MFFENVSAILIVASLGVGIIIILFDKVINWMYTNQYMSFKANAIFDRINTAIAGLAFAGIIAGVICGLVSFILVRTNPKEKSFYLQREVERNYEDYEYSCKKLNEFLVEHPEFKESENGIR